MSPRVFTENRIQMSEQGTLQRQVPCSCEQERPVMATILWGCSTSIRSELHAWACTAHGHLWEAFCLQVSVEKITALNVLPKECLPAQAQVQHVTHSGRVAHTLAQVNESGKAGSQGPANPSTAIGEPRRGQTVSVWTLTILPVGTRHRTCHENSPRVSPTLPKT